MWAKKHGEPAGPPSGTSKSSILTPWGHQNIGKTGPGAFGKKGHVLTSKKIMHFFDLGSIWGSPGVPLEHHFRGRSCHPPVNSGVPAFSLRWYTTIYSVSALWGAPGTLLGRSWGGPGRFQEHSQLSKPYFHEFLAKLY